MTHTIPKRVVLVNGVPASGKSRLARSIADRFGLPILAVDTIKEPFFDHLGIGDREYNRKLGRASYQAIWSTVREAPAAVTFVVDAWFGFQPRSVLEAYLQAAGVVDPLEVWCHAPPEVVAERFRRRLGERSAGHPGESYIPELVALAGRAEPMRLGETCAVDTSAAIDQEVIDQEAIDLEALMQWVGSRLGLM